MNKVAVLLSTYNGSKYLHEQLDSLVVQEGVEVILVARDDGSTKDNTIEILKSYKEKFTGFILLEEPNCGAEESFNRLCKYAYENVEADYYAFCDQDDVWDSDKLKCAVGKLNQYSKDKPNLYFSNLKMVDEKLNFIRDFYAPNEVFIDKDKTLVQIFTYGCTCVFNRKAIELYCAVENTTFHDNWVYCICSYLGNVIYDGVGHIQYRQHGSNLSGHREQGGIKLLKYRILRLSKGNLGHDFELMATQLLHLKEVITPDDLKLITLVSDYRHNFFSRMRLFFSRKYRTGNWFKDVCIRYRIISNSL